MREVLKHVQYGKHEGAFVKFIGERNCSQTTPEGEGGA